MTPIQALESEFGVRIDAEAFNALCEAADRHVGLPATDEEFVAAFRSMAGDRDYSFRGPTAAEIADAVRGVRKSATPALPHSRDCALCQGAGLADWLWPWSGPLVSPSGAVVSRHFQPALPCLCALGEFIRRRQYGDNRLAADANRARVRALLDAAGRDGCGSALERMKAAEDICAVDAVGAAEEARP